MTLHQAMRRVLAELELLSHGKVTSYNPSGHGEADSREPTGENAPPHLEYAQRWREHPTENTLTAARDHLAAWKKRATPLPDTDMPSLEEMVIEEGENYAADQVAAKFGIAPARVARIRLKHDREAAFGLKTTMTPPTTATKEQRVVMLTSQGLSSRQVADQVGLHKTQVLRILARDRNAA